MLGGMTGVGKSQLLTAIGELAGQTLDLEGLAGIFDPRGDFEAFRDGFARNDQAVVAGSLEGIWETFEDALTCM